MCGIVSYIGKPKDVHACYDLTTSLLVKSQTRGTDASGYWASDDVPDDKGFIYWSKAPKKAADFVQTEQWTELRGKSLNLLVSHCRRSSCKGSESINKNNHPFISFDNRTALVHNGNVPEFNALRDSYDVMSDCDSEILLKIMERGLCYDNDFLRDQLGHLRSDTEKLIKDCTDAEMPIWTYKALGLMDIFARINYGAMAVAIGERWDNGTRALWLFRNAERPLHVIDMRQSLGQVYIVSEKQIWRDAVEATPSVKKYVKGNTPIIVFPSMCIWMLTYSDKNGFAARKFKVNRQFRSDTTFEKERPELQERRNLWNPMRIVTNLDFESHEPVSITSSTVHVTSNVTDTKLLEGPTNNGISKKKITNTLIGRVNHTTNRSASQTSNKVEDNLYSYMWEFITTLFKSPKNVCNNQSPGDLRLAVNGVSPHIPDPEMKSIRLDSQDYRDWAEQLRDKYGWKNRLKGNQVLLLEDILEEARNAWLDQLPIVKEIPPFDTKETTNSRYSKDALATANADLNISKHNQIRTDPMTVINRNATKTIEQSDKEKLKDLIHKMRFYIDEIDIQMSSLISEDSISRPEFQQALDSLGEIVNDIESQKFIVESIVSHAVS